MRNLFYSILFMLLPFMQAVAQKPQQTVIPGTHCALKAPKGFVLSSKYKGLQNKSGTAGIMLYELKTSYDSMSAEFTDAVLKKRQLTPVQRKQVKIQQWNGTFILVKQSTQGVSYQKQILLFGDEQFTVLVTGSCLQTEASTTGKQIQDALLDMSCWLHIPKDPLEEAPFFVNLDGTRFKATQYKEGTLYCKEDTPANTPLLVKKEQVNIRVLDYKLYAEYRVKQLSKQEKPEILSVKEITIDSITGYEVIALFKRSMQPSELVYQVMLPIDINNFYLILGQAAATDSTYTDTFRKIAESFYRKPAGN